MPGEGLREIVSGEVLDGLPSEAWNTFVRNHAILAQLVKQFAKNQGFSGGSRCIPALVFNTTGADITADHPILKLDTPCFTYTDDANVAYGALAFNGTTPSTSEKIDQVAVLRGPVSDKASCNAVWIGPAWCDVNLSSSGHDFAVPKASNVELKSDASTGARILWKPSGTGTKRCLILLGGGGGGGSDKPTVGITTGSIAARSGGTPGTGSVSIVKGTGASTGWENWSLTVIPASTYCVAIEIAGDMVIWNAFC